MNISDLKLYKSSIISDANINGGYLSYNQVVSGVLNNVFPNVTYSERTSGVKRYRKLFLKNTNASNEVLTNAHIGIINPSPADDIFTLFSGDSSDTQADIKDSVTGYPISSKKLVGGGLLNADVSFGATSISVAFETSNFDIEVDDMLLITNKVDPSGSGSEEYIKVGGAVTWSGNVATIPLANGLLGSYVASTPTYVSVMLSLGDIYARYNIDGVTSSLGTYNEASYPISVDNQGTIDEIWTITFTSTTVFTCVGARTGATGSGNIASEFIINNPIAVAKYFSIPSGFWTGSWTVGDTLVFTTYSSSAGFWLFEDVPAGANTYSNNNVALRIYGE